MSDSRLDVKIREAALEYNTPPETPRDRIWESIQAKRRGERRPRRVTASELRRALWPVAAAAILILGVALGRFSVEDENGGSGGEIGSELGEVADATDAPTLDATDSYKLAAIAYLSRAEVLLTSFNQTTVAPESAGSFSDWARGLLSDTRLLLDSPAAENLELLILLKDLELILARMVQLADDQSESQHRWLTDELNDGSLLTRLRMQIPAGDMPDGA